MRERLAQRNYVQDTRIAKRMTAARLGQLLGVTQATVTNIEKRRYAISPERAGAILKALGIPRWRWKLVFPDMETIPPAVELPIQDPTGLAPLFDLLPAPEEPNQALVHFLRVAHHLGLCNSKAPAYALAIVGEDAATVAGVS